IRKAVFERCKCTDRLRVSALRIVGDAKIVLCFVRQRMATGGQRRELLLGFAMATCRRKRLAQPQPTFVLHSAMRMFGQRSLVVFDGFVVLLVGKRDFAEI